MTSNERKGPQILVITPKEIKRPKDTSDPAGIFANSARGSRDALLVQDRQLGVNNGVTADPAWYSHREMVGGCLGPRKVPGALRGAVRRGTNSLLPARSPGARVYPPRAIASSTERANAALDMNPTRFD